eukprot:gnl/Spiro4/11966_TR6319_c0_g1_i1.p2 gnl/Spiro4/11966_TR6319_c0_g1~~gnl/Spiro4/11966_TR6319_c0_g1_i1.p2  ORF type:complete len:387 (-),score=126.92 gnl/Spiro4/11966_TR6319_c0_g1_i1:73-1233(-)
MPKRAVVAGASAVLASATVVSLSYAAYRTSPQPQWNEVAGGPRPPDAPAGAARPSTNTWADCADRPAGAMLAAVRRVMFTGCTLFARLWLTKLNTFHVVRDIHYTELVGLMRRRARAQPLITVMNHSTVVDDPAILACAFPFDCIASPRRSRWTLCSDELCFQNTLAAAFSNTGKVMPIARLKNSRGHNPCGGIDQKLLLDVARRVAAGDWVHIFPEGRCVQTGRLLGTSDTDNDAHATAHSFSTHLKWGVGKLIAHSPTPPVVVPLYHTGMQHVLPLSPLTNRLKSRVPRVGQLVTVRVGAPVAVQDLIDQYEARYGPLVRVSADARADSAAGGDWHMTWASTPAQRELYRAITERIQSALASLQDEAASDLARSGQVASNRPVV